MTRKYPAADVKILYGLAAARCAFPDCREEVVLDGTDKDTVRQIGKIAHIVAHSKGGPRSDPNFPKDKLDKYENWVLLCPTCHDKIDAHENKYTVEVLRALKDEHEEWVSESLSDAIAAITFAELEVAIKGISASAEGSQATGDFSVIPPDEKIFKNSLSSGSRTLIAMGLMQASQVKDYLTSLEQVDAGFIERLIEGFRKQYRLLADSGLSSDAVLEGLLRFSSENATDFKARAAGIALVAHLFETCEVFEK